jgi:signal transduction histidine kinase
MDKGLPGLLLSQMDITRAIHGILENALIYNYDGGLVTVRTFADDTYVWLEIDDTGIGISEEELPHIFERFYRIDEARSTSTGGMGLGLALARRIIELHNGQIEVTSTLDEGSTFRVKFPYAITS